MVVPFDVARAAREGNFAVVQAYFASGPQRDVEDDCENDAGVTVHIPLLHFALTLGLYQRLDEDGEGAADQAAGRVVHREDPGGAAAVVRRRRGRHLSRPPASPPTPTR